MSQCAFQARVVPEAVRDWTKTYCICCGKTEKELDVSNTIHQLPSCEDPSRVWGLCKLCATECVVTTIWGK